MLKRIARASVWAKGGIKPEHWRFRGIFRAVLPLTNVLFLWFGVVGVTRSVGSVADAAGSTWQSFWSAGIALSAFACLIGVSFPKLWAVEAFAKTVLIGHVSVYLALYLQRGSAEPTVTATAGLMVILILLPIWRLGDLGLEWAERKAKRKAEREAMKEQEHDSR